MNYLSMWWLLLLILVPLAWLLTQLFIGLVTPASSSGRFYLRSLLKKAGVLQLVSDACVRELVDHDLSAARVLSQLTREGMKTEMVKMLDVTAAIVTVWVSGEQLPFKEDDPVPRTLMKYGVHRGPLRRT